MSVPSRKQSKKRVINTITSGCLRHAKERCSQIHKGLDTDGEDALLYFGLAHKNTWGQITPPPSRRGRRKFPSWSAAFVAEPSSDD